MKLGTLVSESLLSGTQGSEVLASFWNHVIAKFLKDFFEFTIVVINDLLAIGYPIINISKTNFLVVLSTFAWKYVYMKILTS